MKTLVFSCGFASGGTDLMKNVLNAHPDIYIASEMTNLVNIGAQGYDHNTVFPDLAEVNSFQKLLREMHGGHLFESIDYDFKDEIAEKAELPLEDVLRLCLCGNKNVSVWGAKVDPDHMSTLSSLFSNPKFILVTRDVRDVCLSWHKKWGKDMVWCASKWAERMAQGLAFARAIGPDRCLVIKFEDLLAETEKCCREICTFLDLPFSERMPSYHIYTDRWASKINYGSPIIPANKEKWRVELSAKMIRRIEEIACDTMKLLGYTPELISKSKPIQRYEKVMGMCRDFWAILFVGNRTLKQNTLKIRMKTALVSSQSSSVG